MSRRRDHILQARATEAFERSVAASRSAAAGQGDAATVRRLEEALRALPRRTREIFLAHRLDDLSFAQIAEITGLSTDHVEQHFARALLQVVRHLDGEVAPRRSWLARLFG